MLKDQFHFLKPLSILCALLVGSWPALAGGPENQRCLTREQLNIEPVFSACPVLEDEASVSDNSFIGKLYINGGPDKYTVRWWGENYFNEDNFSYNQTTGAYDGFCGTRACSIHPPGWVQQEHWGYYVGTLLAENVGTWTYEELHDGEVIQSRVFEVRELGLTALSGADQVGVVDQSLPVPLVLKLESFEGIGIEDESIGWSITGPKGAKNAAVFGIGGTSKTDRSGIEEATIRLGSKPGNYTVTLNNRRMTTQPAFTFTAIEDIEDAQPVQEHPDVEEGVGFNGAQQCDSVGNPVGLSLGNKFQREADFEATGISPLEFVRYHNSLGYVSDTFAGYWTHSYDRRIEIPPDPHTDPVKVARPDGKKINFSWTGTAYQPFPGIRAALVRTGGGWRFTDAALTVEYFDADGRLLNITDRHGRIQTAVRNRRGQLFRVDSNTGGSISFDYDGEGRLSTVTDPAGRTWGYRYETLGRLAFVDAPDGTTRGYHYEDLRHAHALTGITQESGQRFAWYEYDDSGLAIASYHAGGANRVDIRYEEDGSRIVLDPLGNATVYRTRIENKRGLLDGISGPVCSQGCGQTDTEYSYDEMLNVTSKTVYGVTTRYGAYDAKGQPGYIIEAHGTPEEKRIEYEHDPAFFDRVTRITEPSVYEGESRITNRSYDFNGNLLRETITGFDPHGQAVSRTITSTWDGPFGQITSRDGPRVDVADVTTYEYYPNDPLEGVNRGRLKAVIDSNGLRLRENIVYSPTGKILSESRPNGIAVIYEYYAGNDRIRSITESGGDLFRRTRWEYWPAGDVKRITIDNESGDEVITEFRYDEARRLVRVESVIPGSVPATPYRWVSYEFDAAGNRIKETLRSRDTPQDDVVTQRVFDAHDRIDTIQRGGIIEDFDHNPNGTLAALTDGNGNTTRYSYDAFKRLTRTEKLGQVMILTGYDTHGSIVSVTGPGNQRTGFLYDDLGNRLLRESPDTGITSFTYNESGQVLSRTDAKGQRSRFGYDATGRPIFIDRDGADYDVSYSYDSCFNGAGRLCEISTGWGHTIRYEWNDLGDLAAVLTGEGRIRYTWGPNGAPASIEYPSGRTVLFRPFSRELSAQIRLRSPGSPDSVLLEDIRYSPLGRPVAWRYANGRQFSMSLDARHRPVAIDVPGSWNWQAGSYDGNDNLLEVSDSFDAFSYGYDAFDRLISAATATRSIVYAFDAAGNRLSRSVDGQAETGTYEPESNRMATYGDAEYVLDSNGNTTASIGPYTGNSFTYSVHNRLLGISDSRSSATLATYRYDALGRRVTKSTQGEIRKFLYGIQGELLAEMDGAGRILHEFVYLDGRPVADLSRVAEAPPPDIPAVTIIDDGDAAVFGSNWQAKSSPLAVNGSYLKNRKRDDRAVYWYIDETGTPGPHDIYVKWLNPEGDGVRTQFGVDLLNTDSTGFERHGITVEHADHAEGDWVYLGKFDIKPRHDNLRQKVRLTGSDNRYGSEGTFLEADAVRLVPVFAGEGSAKPKFIHGDQLGTPRTVTDETGRVIWTAAYLPFGEAIVNEDPDGDGVAHSLNLRLPGQYHDAESGLHYNYFRDYDPRTGRYIESDPIGLNGGLNTFLYAGANPLRFVDPSGLAYFAKRPLRGMPWLGPASCNPIDDFFNTEISHEQLFFEDGESPLNIGFFNDGQLRTEPNPTGYRCRSGTYNDCIMRKAYKSVGRLGAYCLLGQNCQTWAERVRERYAQLEELAEIRKECGVCN